MGKVKSIVEIEQEKLEEFINQMKAVGVKDKTIKQVLKEIHEYQESLIKRELKRLFNQMKETISRESQE